MPMFTHLIHITTLNFQKSVVNACKMPRGKPSQELISISHTWGWFRDWVTVGDGWCFGNVLTLTFNWLTFCLIIALSLEGSESMIDHDAKDVSLIYGKINLKGTDFRNRVKRTWWLIDRQWGNGDELRINHRFLAWLTGWRVLRQGTL